MIRLDDQDFKDPERLARHAALVHLSPEAFMQRFAPVVRRDSRTGAM
jgi:hypothetical protein